MKPEEVCGEGATDKKGGDAGFGADGIEDLAELVLILELLRTWISHVQAGEGEQRSPWR